MVPQVMCVPQASIAWQGQPTPHLAPQGPTAQPRETLWPRTVYLVTLENIVLNTT